MCIPQVFYTIQHKGPADVLHTLIAVFIRLCAGCMRSSENIGPQRNIQRLGQTRAKGCTLIEAAFLLFLPMKRHRYDCINAFYACFLLQVFPVFPADLDRIVLEAVVLDVVQQVLRCAPRDEEQIRKTGLNADPAPKNPFKGIVR